MHWVIVLLGITTNAVASILVKVAMMPPYQFPSLWSPMSLLNNWPFWGGLGLYGISFCLYAAALSRLPLNVVYPVMTSGSIITISLFSLFLFHEPFHWTTIIGILLVIAGVLFITTQIS